MSSKERETDEVLPENVTNCQKPLMNDMLVRLGMRTNCKYLGLV